MATNHKMNILEFCKNNKIKTLPVNIEITNGKKIYLTGNKGKFRDGTPNFTNDMFHKYSYDECFSFTNKYPECNHLFIDTTEIHQFDVDCNNDDWYDPFKKLYDVDTPYYLSVNKRKPHYFYKHPEDMPDISIPETTKKYIDQRIEFSHDVLVGMPGFARRDEVVLCADEDFDITEVVFYPKQKNSMIVKDEDKDEEEKTDITDKQLDDEKVIISLINMIDPKYADTYNDWFAIINAISSYSKQIKKIKIYKEIARTFSRKSSKYEYKSFELVWKNAEYNYSVGTIKHYAKLSNEMAYYELINNLNDVNVDDALKEDFINKGNDRLSLYFTQIHHLDIIRYNSKIYFYYNNKWRLVEEHGSIIKHQLKKDILELYKLFIEECENVLQDNEINEIRKSKNKDFLKYFKDNTRNIDLMLKNVYSLLLNEICADYTRENDPFDYNPFIIAFDNCVYDLKNNTFREHRKEDYIFMTTKNEYKEPTEEQLQTIDKIFKTSFPDEELRKCYLSILKCGLNGERLDEVFIIAFGGGRNGKGVINELFQYLLGDYYCNLNIAILTKPIKTGSNEEMTSIHKKRIIIAKEPSSDGDQKLQMNNIRNLTGTGNIQGRGHYEKCYDVKINGNVLLECNKLPFIHTEGNQAEEQRFIAIEFESFFTNDDALIDNIKVFKKDKNLKGDVFIKAHYCALFKYIVDNCADNNLYIPKRVKDAGLKYLHSKDEFRSWFNEEYEECDDGYVKCKDIYNLYKESNYFRNLSKAKQRQNNYEYLLKEELISKFGKYYKPRKSYYNKIQLNGDCLINYRKRQEDDEDEEDIVENINL